MDTNFNRLKLKLDMVYRDLSVEDAQPRFTALLEAPAQAALEPVGERVPPKKPARKIVKALVPKSK